MIGIRSLKIQSLICIHNLKIKQKLIILKLFVYFFFNMELGLHMQLVDDL